MTHRHDDSLQRRARQAVDHWRCWRNGPSIPDSFGDTGFWAYSASAGDYPVRWVVGCKNYERSTNGLYRGRYASFTPNLVGRALSARHRKAPYREDAPTRAGARHPRRSWLLLFAGPGHDPAVREWVYTIDDAWVFDPERVFSHGDGGLVPHTKRTTRDTEVFDLDAKANGVKLGEFLSGRKRPEPAREPVEAGRQVTFREVSSA